MARPSKLTLVPPTESERLEAEHVTQLCVGPILCFVQGEITEEKAKSHITEEDGLVLSLMRRSSEGAGQVVLDWARNVTAFLGFEYVYIFKGTHKGVCRHKIGKAKNIKDRRSVFSVKLPFDIELVALFRVKNALQTEAAIHKAQAHNRVGGEWFDLDPDAFDEVCRLGICVELADLAEAMQDNVFKTGKERPMNDAEYIAYMEGLLAMRGVSFSRDKEISDA